MTVDPPNDDEAAAEAARQRLTTAVDEAMQATKAIADPDRGYAAAKLLVDALNEATYVAGRLHAQAAARIRAAANLSYAQLGARLGVGKTRAEQLVKLAAKAAGRDKAAP